LICGKKKLKKKKENAALIVARDFSK